MTDLVQEGELVAGKYRVERVLGRGGMGVVVAARHVELEERVALKLMLPEAVSEPTAVARFLKEARAAVRIKNEHVARVYDVGQLESGSPYMVLEYLEGSDLAAVLEARGPLPLDQALDYVAQACEAIADAHAQGIVHRDLKPSNLMLVKRSDGSECVKVLDFGISKMTPAAGAMSEPAMTMTATSLGTPLYMSPEQMMSAHDVDGRTDVWALGTILYELLAGAPPFTAETLQALGVLIATRDPASLRERRSNVPPGVEAAILRCLAKTPGGRFADVAEFARALAPFAPEHARISIERSWRILHPATASTTGPEGGAFVRTPSGPSNHAFTPQSTVAYETGAGWGRTSPSTTRRRKTLMVAGGTSALLVVAGITAAVLLGGHHPPSAGSSPVPGAPPSAAAMPSHASPALTAAIPVPAPPPEPEPVAPKEATPRAPTIASVAAHEPPPPQSGGPSTHAAGGAPARPASGGVTRPPVSPSQKGSAYEDM